MQKLNASDDRGINVVRETVKNFVSAQNFGGQKQHKLVILDESDSMTSAAQFALRRCNFFSHLLVIEKYSSSSRFCIVCNYVSKIIPALQSRCTRFKFKQIPVKDAQRRVSQICEQENLNITPKGIESIFELCEGDMRKVVNMLQSVSVYNKGNAEENQKIDENFIYELVSCATPSDIDFILKILFNENVPIAYQKIKEIQDSKGISLQIIIKELSSRVIQLQIEENWKIHLIKRLSEIEYRLSICCDEKI